VVRRMGRMNNKIKFSKNWNNKLNQKYFTTIRRYTKRKEYWYLDRENEVFDVILNGKKFCEAELILAEVKPFTSLPNGLLMADTGLPLHKAIELFEKMGVDTIRGLVIVLTFRRLK